MADAHTRDLIVVGASAGGLVALPALLGQLPRDLPAAVVIVQHLHPRSTPALADILARGSALPVTMAEQGQPLRAGRVAVAPPGWHTLIDADHLLLVGGPRENRARPSINRLFRSAAAEAAGRTIGVLLTGMLDDGVVGLSAIKRAGGLVLVQDPADAEYPEMPANAVARVAIDQVLPLARMGAALTALAGQPAPADPAPGDLVLEARLEASYGRNQQALWAAVRALQERAVALSTLGRDARRMGRELSADEFEISAGETAEQAERARQFVLDLQRLLRDD